jgi:hypothetical protein
MMRSCSCSEDLATQPLNQSACMRSHNLFYGIEIGERGGRYSD